MRGGYSSQAVLGLFLLFVQHGLTQGPANPPSAPSAVPSVVPAPAPPSPQATCQSYGADFVNGGSYCIDTGLNDYFAFGTEFVGCTVNDTQGDVIPIVIDPNEDNYYCSGIPTLPDYADQISTCNVEGYELRKSQMFSGAWIVVIEGLTFAWMRTFNINASPPVVITQTPTATFTVTSTPTVTFTSTLTNTIPTTLPPVTLTFPSTTSTRTIFTTPPLTIVRTTSYLTIPIYVQTFSQTTATVTSTRNCQVASTVRDVFATVRPALAQAAAALITPAPPTPPGKRRHGREWAAHYRREAERLGLFERQPDPCNVTITTLAPAISSYITVTGATTTLLSTAVTNITQTITPTPVTVLSGRARTTITITAPTPSLVLTIPALTIITTTNTIVATVTSTDTVNPSGVQCVGDFRRYFGFGF